jgi:nucleoside-diphosphate-sugar epimerase
VAALDLIRLFRGPRRRCRSDRARARNDGAGIYNIVDDEPALVREWLPVLANVLGAKPPRHFPRSLARLFAGEALVMMGTESRGASNAKAKRELG